MTNDVPSVFVVYTNDEGPMVVDSATLQTWRNDTVWGADDVRFSKDPPPGFSLVFGTMRVEQAEHYVYNVRISVSRIQTFSDKELERLFKGETVIQAMKDKAEAKYKEVKKKEAEERETLNAQQRRWKSFV